MRRYLFQVVSFCLLAACVNSGGYVYTPPPPPMPFAVAWDPQEAKSRQFAGRERACAKAERLQQRRVSWQKHG